MSDYLVEQSRDPKWKEAGRVHDWRSYATDEIRLLWPSFAGEQKSAIVRMLDEIASREHWD